MTSQTLARTTIIMSGGSRGIGLAIALRAARDGANVALLAKTAEPHPKLAGTVYSAAAEIEAAGGHALPIVGDVRNDDDVAGAVEAAAAQFGGIDIVVNNASAFDLADTRSLSMKKFDLMHAINTRGTLLLSKSAIPELEKSRNGHILTLSPPIDLRPQWAGAYLAYTIAKYGMSLCTLGLAEELRSAGIAANSLWPRTTIATDAVRNLLGGDSAVSRARTPEIVADAAYAVLTSDSRMCTGNFFIDDEVLAAGGVTELRQYQVDPAQSDLDLDLFLD